MPTYEYECTKCGTITEVFQSITEKARRKLKKTDEPKCDCNAPVTRLIGTGGGIIFKGSGFYQTDYRSENYKKAAKADKPKSDKNDKTSTDKGASSPAKAESKTSGEKKAGGGKTADGGHSKSTAKPTD